MEPKSWIWKKKSTEKRMIAVDKINRGNEDELQANLADKVELQRNLKILDEKLLAALAEINAKDEIAKKQTNIAREAIEGWEKAETEVLALKNELGKAAQQRVADEERLHSAESALEECVLQLRFVREEQEKRIHDAVMETSKEHEKRIIILEEKLAESNKKLSKLGLENTQLSNTLSVKEKIIDEQHLLRVQLDYDLRAVVSQLESTQRENASLSYEIQVLEKELEIRNEEREFNRRTSEMAHKQYLESVKKIAKLETEAQRLRLLVQKRLPGPADVAKMKNVSEVTRRRSNPFPMESTDFKVDDTYSKKITFLTEQLKSFEEENKLLKEFLHQKTSELSKSVISDMGSDEKISMAESWTPSYNTVGASDIGLMDDFVEMEKLALVSVDKPFADDIKVILPSGKDSCNTDMMIDKKDAIGYSFDENMNKSIQKLIELIEGIRISEKNDDLSPYKTSETPTGYTVHVFQWKTSELRTILEEFLQICNKLADGKVAVEDFAKELTSSLAWIVNHCFSLQDVCSMKDQIKKQLEWDETRSESEVEGGTHLSADKLTFPKDQLPGWPMASSWNIRNKICHLEPNVSDEVRKLNDDVANLESANKDLESESIKCASLIIQPQESEGDIKEHKEILEDQTEVDVMVRDIEKYPTKTFIYEAHQETKSTEEQESMTENDKKSDDLDHDETTLSSTQELTAASDKLAECQETIVNLGKQLKAMASLPIDTSLSDDCEITTSPLPNENNNQRVSLLDKMITEDPTGAPRSQKPEGIDHEVAPSAILAGNSNPVAVMSPRMFVSVEGVKDEEDEEALVKFLSIVPNKKKNAGGGILKRLFRRGKKGSKK